ncbi:hypothetical protein NQ317_002601 [Molorchus minor]|uniref:PiggyBac transposable element-derived protein domain-containing protein n=1 Tax=Molorchus minor TaxID=1323400 RepID=A0ABQ9JTG7_9CUCU|nr:hypothetical protein NQ317_002601 [Molorchus minor]
MARTRFEQILSNLHCNDNTQLPKDNKDKLYKLRPLITKLNDNFRSFYKTTRRISVDESMILFKDRSTLKQYNPQKPIKRGYKIWCVADQLGYVCNFDVYQGKNEALENEFAVCGLGERMVLSLTKPYWGIHKIVYFDNYFTSIPFEESCVTRTQKDGSKAEIRCPTVVTDYNRHMGGVDHADQLRTTYEAIRLLTPITGLLVVPTLERSTYMMSEAHSHSKRIRGR